MVKSTELFAVEIIDCLRVDQVIKMNFKQQVSMVNKLFQYLEAWLYHFLLSIIAISFLEGDDEMS